MTVPPRLPLTHLDRMTDSTGMIQHAIHSVPRRESGYTTDDNARALRLCARLWDSRPSDRLLSRVSCYLSFLEHARHPVRGFHNYLSYQRDWLDTGGTGDCQGQAVLALAEVLSSKLPKGFRRLARELLNDALPALEQIRSLRAQAYVIQAWAILYRADFEETVPMAEIARNAAGRLVECYERSRRSDWHWFEPQMTYANAVLPHALFDAAECWLDETFLHVAESTLGFLEFSSTAEGVFWPIGNHDWYSYGAEKSLYDQQPVEASTMASAALAAYAQLGNEKYLALFHRARGWFLGENSLQLPLADGQIGSCCDGLESRGVNENQGAESTLAYLWTELQIGDLSRPADTSNRTSLARGETDGPSTRRKHHQAGS